MEGIVENNLQISGSLSPVFTITGQKLLKTLNIQGKLSKLNQITASVEKVDGKLNASLSNTLSLGATLQKELEVSGNISPGNYTYNDQDREYYTGSYQAVSSPREDQILPTAEKIMSNDVTVLKIPYYETINLSGGYTVTISE